MTKWIAAFGFFAVIAIVWSDAHADADTGFHAGAAVGRFSVEIDQTDFAADDTAVNRTPGRCDGLLAFGGLALLSAAARRRGECRIPAASRSPGGETGRRKGLEQFEHRVRKRPGEWGQSRWNSSTSRWLQYRAKPRARGARKV